MKKASGKILKKKNEEQGTILGVTLVLTVALLIIALPFLFKLSAQYKATEKSFKSLAALSLAEAGVERAIWELNNGDISSWSGDDSLRTLTISSFQSSGGTAVGDIQINVADPEGDNPVVESLGDVLLTGDLTVNKTVRVVLEREVGDYLFDNAAFANTKIKLYDGSIVDSYDSRDGQYGGSNVGSNGNISTNGVDARSIELVSGAEVNGDAYSGFGSDPEIAIDVNLGANLNGSKLTLSESKELPSVTPPEGLPLMGDYRLLEGNQDTINTSGQYSSLDLDANSKVTIATDVTLYITGTFNMDGFSELEIAEGVELTIYLGDDFKQKSGASINNLIQDPSKLLILGTDTCMNYDYKNSSEFYGAVYAPRASLDFDSVSEFYGAILADDIKLASNAQIHYDEALEALDIATGEMATYVVKSWKEKIQ